MNTPSIRFKGCTGDWEQRKLEDFGEATGGTSIESEFSEDGIYKVISIGSYSEDSTYRDQGIRAVFSEKTRNKILNKGDLTMILNDKTASGNIIGRVLLIEKSGVYVYNQRTERIEINREKYDSIFIYEMLNAPEIRDKIIKQSQGNTQIYVNWSAISQTEYLVPNIDEQRIIGEFLHKIGNLIVLHQRKCDSLKQVKKYMLQKMFPKQGEKVPEIRFAGFSGPWEQLKILDVAPLQRGFDLPTTEMKPGEYPVVMSNGIGGYHSEYKAKGPGVITGRSGTIGKLHYVSEDYWPHNTSLWVTDFKNNYPKFIYHLYDWLDLSRFGTGSGVPTLNRNDVHDTKVAIPEFKEQKKVADYLDGIDNLVTLHQQKSDSLKEIKKFMLQNMFPRE